MVSKSVLWPMGWGSKEATGEFLKYQLNEQIAFAGEGLYWYSSIEAAHLPDKRIAEW